MADRIVSARDWLQARGHSSHNVRDDEQTTCTIGPVFVHQPRLREGDVILRFDDRCVRGIDALLRLLTEERIGIDVPVTVVRKGKLHTLHVTPVEKSR